MTAVYFDLIKEAAYELWLETHKPFCAIDIFDKLCKSIDYRDLLSFRLIGRILKNSDWAKPKKASGVNLAYATYTWRGDRHA